MYIIWFHSSLLFRRFYEPVNWSDPIHTHNMWKAGAYPTGFSRKETSRPVILRITVLDLSSDSSDWLAALLPLDRSTRGVVGAMFLRGFSRRHCRLTGPLSGKNRNDLIGGNFTARYFFSRVLSEPRSFVMFNNACLFSWDVRVIAFQHISIAKAF